MNRNAYRGRNVEILFRNSVSDHPSVINAIKSAYSITGNFRTGISSGIHAEKRDVRPHMAPEKVQARITILLITWPHLSSGPGVQLEMFDGRRAEART